MSDPFDFEPEQSEIAEVVSSGDRVESLKAMRDVLAEEIDRIRRSSKHMETPGRDVATMTRELSRVMAELSELNVGAEADPVDEIARKRKERRARRTGTEDQ